MNKLKAIWPDVAAIVFFVAISCLYFLKPIEDNKVLGGGDNVAATGQSVELQHYMDTHDGERSRWTTSVFCGMPTYQISPSYDSSDTLSSLKKVYSLSLPTVASYIFMLLLGFYIMLRCFNFKVWLASLGAVVWAFSSYFFIIIAAGHIWKVYTLCFIPPTIAGMLLCYRGKYLWGIGVTGLFTAWQILSNHVQMSYYFLFVMGFISLAFLIDAVRQKTLSKWLRATVCFAFGALLGACINLSNLFHTWQYSKETMRGKTELTSQTKDEANQTSSGLERSYITEWSYGIGETWSLLVPNVKGGASVELARNAKAMEKCDPRMTQDLGGFPQYFGEKPFTSGPVYVGAFVLMLAILALFVCRRYVLTWCLFGATVLSIMLAWGKNMMWFTNLFLDIVPMYDKFRTVESILVIAEFTIPFLALMALREIIERPECLRGKDGNVALGASFGLTGGFALLFWLMPTLFFPHYISHNEEQMFADAVAQGYPQDVINQLIDNLSAMRRAMFTSDALRSFIVVTVGTLAVLVWRWGKIKSLPMVACVTILCLADMWSVNKRYLNDDNFTERQTGVQMIPQSEADRQILQDPDPYYRVLDETVSTFNSNNTSFYHKSIGGYHAAKLRRYQEIIETYLAREMAIVKNVHDQGFTLDRCPGDSLLPVLNMLNMKYAILPDNGAKMAMRNPWANGNAWFVNNLQYVDNADAELAALGQLYGTSTAVADASFREVLGEGIMPIDSTATVTLTAYEANSVSYDVASQKGGVVVFSEVYYPGWQCTIDGEDVPIGRANYILRAVKIPAGAHKVVMTFDPQSLHTTEAIAYAALIVLLLLILAGIALPLYKQYKQKHPQNDGKGINEKK